MSSETNQVQELPVTFKPQLYLQRRGWVLDMMRREGVREVIDIGCGEGELLACLCNPAPWLPPPPADLLSHVVSSSPEPSSASSANEDDIDGADDKNDDVAVDALAALHRDVLHPVRLAGLDISASEVESAVRITKSLASPSPSSSPPPDAESDSGSEPTEAPTMGYSYGTPMRWEPLEVALWHGSVVDVNPAFVDTECIVATEVIEHLPEPVLQRFAPVVLGAYHPRLVLLSTPSYDFNARFIAPDAPLTARSGWPDPTGRTERVFRHADHKFEWTRDEFARWCEDVAARWGYTVEISGVGHAAETDEWGRDDELGWASQTAAFTRKDGEEDVTKRLERWTAADEAWKADGCPEQGPDGGAHRRMDVHQHAAESAAQKPKPLADVGALVVDKLAEYRETAVPLPEMWFDRAVGRACGGWVDWLVRAVHAHAGLTLRRIDAGVDDLLVGTDEEWVIELDPTLHHLISEKEDPWAKPPNSPDSEETVNPWDPYDEDENATNADEHHQEVRVWADDEAAPYVSAWAAATAESTDNVGWESTEVIWGKPGEYEEEAFEGWGIPENYNE